MFKIKEQRADAIDPSLSLLKISGKEAARIPVTWS